MAGQIKRVAPNCFTAKCGRYFPLTVPQNLTMGEDPHVPKWVFLPHLVCDSKIPTNFLTLSSSPNTIFSLYLYKATIFENLGSLHVVLNISLCIANPLTNPSFNGLALQFFDRTKQRRFLLHYPYYQDCFNSRNVFCH